MPQHSVPPDAERHESGRGAPSGRGRRRASGVRAFNLYISVLPTALMAILGVIAVAAVLTLGTVSMRAQVVLVLLLAAAVAVLGAAALGASEATRRANRRSVRPAASAAPAAPGGPGGPEDWQRRLAHLRSVVSHGRNELHELNEWVAAGNVPALRSPAGRPSTDDTFAQLEYDLRDGQAEAWNVLVTTAGARTGRRSAEHVEAFVVNLARRMQTLSYRAIQGLDGLENQVEDPDLLKGLFRVDHLNTRMRRQAESLAVIGGATSRRRWTRPVTVYEVLRSAIAEVEHYNRVKVAPPVEGTLDGGAVADTVHLLAELVENATKFAPPQTQVIIRAEPVTAGLAIEIEDRGLGIPRDDQRRLNDLLSDPDYVDTYDLIQDGRIGMLVVSALAHRHRVAVRLQTNIYGGTQAIVVVPKELIGAEPEEAAQGQTQGQEPARAAAEPPAAPTPPAASPAALPTRVPQETYAERPSVPAPAATAGPSTGPITGPTPRVETRAEPAGDGRARPVLPRRRAQTHIAAELLTAPLPREDGGDNDPSPGMFAAFQQGMRSGQDEGPADEPMAPTDGISRT
ncbi:MAG TPA: ATP-binding protein [Streptosporangiaceae bacterium]|jgi:signal transduction histidine kinase